VKSRTLTLVSFSSLVASLSMNPEGGLEQHVIVRDFNLGKFLASSLSGFTATLGTETFLGVHTAEQLIPQFQEETSVVRLIGGRYSMMKVMLEGSIDPGMMGIGPFGFIAPVQVHTVSIEKDGELNEQHIYVDGSDQREEQQRGRSEELIHVFVSDDREGAGIVENMMILVLRPEELGDMAQSMVVEFQEISSNPTDTEGGDKVSSTEIAVIDAAVSL